MQGEDPAGGRTGHVVPWGAGDLLDSMEGAKSHAACILVLRAPPTWTRKTWVTTLLWAWLFLPFTQQLLEYLPRGLARCWRPQDTSGRVFVTMGKCFCFPTSGLINSTNEQNFAVRLIVSSREPPSRIRQMFFLQIRGSQEDVSEPGAWRKRPWDESVAGEELCC
jgi:hypothetical protein